MKRVCIIGNSHAACWLAAGRRHSAEIAQLADVQFFMLGGYNIGKLRVAGEELVLDDAGLQEKLAESSNGLISIRPQDYDHIVIVSLTFGYRNLTDLFSRFGVFKGAYRSPGLTFVSQECLETCAEGVLRASLAVQLREKIAEITDRPVTFSPSPCQTERALISKDVDFAELCRTRQQAYLYDIFVSSAKKVAGQCSASVVFQDPETLIPGGCYTRREYGRAAINSSMACAGTADTSHMNIEFGRRELENALRFIDLEQQNAD